SQASPGTVNHHARRRTECLGTDASSISPDLTYGENELAIDKGFARLLSPSLRNAEALTGWMVGVREDDLPHLHAFTRGLDQDRTAVDAAVTLPLHNGGTEGVNTRSKLIKRQMYGRAGFPLLRHRTLLQ
ncbi:transposase, partial [Nocardiopsis rhodophaea]|uniref:transposase n=1 Tax=Nocardiopsis rhodophaea TaxID=280238 RepID=UPI0039F02A01